MSRDKGNRLREAACGWLEIEISGPHTEHLLNLALQQGLELQHIRRYGEQKIKARLLLAELYELRPLLTASRCRFRVVRRGGRPFWLARARQRAGLITGGLLFAVALYLLCSFVWVVEVQSIFPLSAEENQRLLLLAKQQGLEPGAFAPGLDWQGISQGIAAAAGDLTFTQAERQGVKALIHVVRRVDVQEREDSLPGDIVALCDGLIEEILVRSGTAAVQPGVTVKTGDVLVYGWDGAGPVAASALISARVWGEGEGAWPLTERGLRPSGQSARGVSVGFKANGREFQAAVQGEKEPSYEFFNHNTQVYEAFLWRNIRLPVEIILDAWYEQEPYVTSYTQQQALYHATQRAIDQVLAHLPRRCVVLSQKTLELPNTFNQVNVRVIWEARADIGLFYPVEHLSLPEALAPQTPL